MWQWKPLRRNRSIKAVAPSALLPNRFPTTLSSTSLTLLKVRTRTETHIQKHSGFLWRFKCNIQNNYSNNLLIMCTALLASTQTLQSLKALRVRATRKINLLNSRHACVGGRCSSMLANMSCGFIVGHCIELNSAAGGTKLLHCVRLFSRSAVWNKSVAHRCWTLYMKLFVDLLHQLWFYHYFPA